jgi:hypothetical protein
MKKASIILILCCSALAALGQGTVRFSNDILSRIQLEYWGPEIYPYVPTDPGLFNYGLFYGIGQSTSLTFLSQSMGVNSTVTAGIIASPTDGKTPMTAVAIPGTVDGQSDVWIQIKAWRASYGTDWMAAMFGGFFGQTDVRNVPRLGPSLPNLIWQSASGTNPQLFNPFTIFGIPEPSISLLAGIGAAARLLFGRRKAR